MNVLVINGSMRTDSQSLKVSNWLADAVKGEKAVGTVLDLHATPLPLFDVGETEAPNAPKILKQLEEADAFVFVSPEWNGMTSHSILNMLNYVGTQMANKPVMLVGVTSGHNGQYPVAQMRSMGYKNNHFVISPENLVVRDVSNVMNDTTMTDEAEDTFIKNRAMYALNVLVEYAKALKSVRESGVIDLETYGHGM